MTADLNTKILSSKLIFDIVLHSIYRVLQEECARRRESVPYVKLYRYNPKHLCPKLNGYGDNGKRKVWALLVSTYCTPSVTSYLSNAPARSTRHVNPVTLACALQRVGDL